MTESEYSPEELDLMAKAYERTCDKLQEFNNVLPEQIERARVALVGAIAEAMEKGERSEEFLVCAALARFCNLVDAVERLMPIRPR
jgi:hypothetical protein